MSKEFPLHPDLASTFALQVDLLYFLLVGLSVLFAAGVVFVLVLFAIKYRRRSDDDRPHPVHGSVPLELAWSIIPLFMAIGVFTLGAEVYFRMYRSPADAIDIYVVGKQWMWKIQHPEGRREINELHIPVNQPVQLTMTSEDVIHAFSIPAFRTKKDVVPGRYNTIWFEATKTGEYHLFCAEYCGTQHSTMIGTVYVMEPEDYQDWLGGGVSGETMAEAGRAPLPAAGMRHLPQGRVGGPRSHPRGPLRRAGRARFGRDGRRRRELPARIDPRAGDEAGEGLHGDHAHLPGSDQRGDPAPAHHLHQVPGRQRVRRSHDHDDC